MYNNYSDQIKKKLFEYVLRLGDDNLILGHRLSEWCGHAPILEEDIALTNIALDCIGQASNWLKLAGKLEGKGRDEDNLAYFRNVREFKNLQLAEYPNTDFAYTIVRQFFFDVYFFYLYEVLSRSSDEDISGLAEKSLKEVKYHFRHSKEWILRLGDGTEESRKKAQNAIDDLYPLIGEMFEIDLIIRTLMKENILPDITKLKTSWETIVESIIEEATLTLPENTVFTAQGSRMGNHSEQLGHILAEMQIVARSFPDAKW